MTRSTIWVLTPHTGGGYLPKAFATRQGLDDYLNARSFRRSRELPGETHLLDADGGWWVAYCVEVM
jgi:hypothetical protein